MKTYMSRFPALSYYDFRLFWIGSFLSMIGSQMQLVGLNWHIYVLTNSAFALGLIGLFRFIPIAVFSLLGGNVADSHNRKVIINIAETSLLILSLILGIATFTKTITPTLMYIVTFLSAIAIAFDLPARQALAPSLVKREHLANAMSLNSITFQTAMIIGPALSGLVIARFGVGAVYIFNAFSFISVIIAIILMRASGNPHGERPIISVQSIKEGLVFVKSKTMIWSTMILDFICTFFASATVLLPIFAKDILRVGPEGLGILYAASSIGAVTAGFVLAHMQIVKNQGKILLISVGVFGVATLLFGFSNYFLLSFIFLTLIGAGDSISAIIRGTIRQLVTPDHIRGRMSAINMIFFMGGPQLGEFEAGLVASLIGAPLSVATGGAATIVAVIIMAYAIPTLRKYQGHEHLSDALYSK